MSSITIYPQVKSCSKEFDDLLPFKDFDLRILILFTSHKECKNEKEVLAPMSTYLYSEGG